MRATADALRRTISAIVHAGGSAEGEANLVADHLVQANLAGHDSHGVGMIPTYVRHLKAGLVVPNTRAKTVKDDGPALMFDGGRGYGRPVAGEAMAAAIARCRQTGVVAVTLANAHHIGRVGAYGEMASGAGLVSLHFVNVTDHRALVAPFRGTDGRFVTNPVCIAFPGTDRQPPLLLDMATSAIAMGKVRVARNEGHEVEPGILIDPKGKPTRDPNVMYSEPHGALLPFGGHKGYALALAMHALGVLCSGTADKESTGYLFIAFKPDLLVPLEDYRRALAAEIAVIKATPRQEGVDQIRIPGERAYRERARLAREGIEIDRRIHDALLQLAEGKR